MKRYSVDWFRSLYKDVGDGIACFRPTWLYEGREEDGKLVGCLCCPKNTMLCLLPDEEKVFEAELNDTDFVLSENPALPGRKIITCSKMGMCGGRKPFVCRTHPFHFMEGTVLVQESQCRLRASTFLSFHGRAIEKLKAIVYQYALQHEVLGYGRREGDKYIDYER